MMERHPKLGGKEEILAFCEISGKRKKVAI